MNELQNQAYDLMKQGKNIFLTGSPGCGKSYVIRKFYENFCTKLKIGLTSTTGVSAIIIGGKTLHSFLGINLAKENAFDLYRKLSYSSKYSTRWMELDILIIDEVSMLSAELFDKLEEVARYIRGNTKPFGGIQLILSGDFLQLPVVGSKLLCFEAQKWSTCIETTIQLTEIVRQNDKIFQKCLNEIRINQLSQESKELIATLNQKQLNPKFGIEPTIIMTTNKNVDIINNKKNTELGSSEYFDYEIEIKPDSEYKFSSFRDQERIIDGVRKSCNAKDRLMLCVGSQVMLLYNRDQDRELVNGSRGVVIGFSNDFPIVRFINGIEEVIEYYTWKFTDDENTPMVNISMIPLKLAWAITVHSCQGQTLDYAHIDFDYVFEYGQVYVSMSRVKNIEGLSIKNLSIRDIKAHPKALEFYRNLENSESE